MKKFLFWFLIFSTTFSLFLFLPFALHADPHIVFDEEIRDFGNVVQGEKVEYVFTFVNDGNEELVIEKVTSS